MLHPRFCQKDEYNVLITSCKTVLAVTQWPGRCLGVASARKYPSGIAHVAVPPAALTIATMPARTASGSDSHRLTMTAESGSIGVLSASCAPDCAALGANMRFSRGFLALFDSPRGYWCGRTVRQARVLLGECGGFRPRLPRGTARWLQMPGRSCATSSSPLEIGIGHLKMMPRRDCCRVADPGGHNMWGVVSAEFRLPPGPLGQAAS